MPASVNHNCWLLLFTRISRDLFRVVPVPYAPFPLSALTLLFLSVFAERLVRLLVATRLHFLGSCHARHGTKATAIQLLFPWGTFPFTLPYPLSTSLPAVLLLAPFPFLASFGQNVWTSFLPDSNLRRKLWFVVERARFSSAVDVFVLVPIVARHLLRGGVLRVVIAIVIVLVLWQLCILFRYLSHSLANAAQSFA